MVESLNTGAHVDASHTPAPEGHDQAMADAFDKAQELATGADTTTGQEAGEKILGKFDSYEDLAAAYRELESKFSRGEHKQQQDTVTPEQHEAERQAAAEEAVSRAEGVDMETLSQEYLQNGSLSDASYEALEKAGIPRSVVDEYIQGQEARATQLQEQVVESIGGQEAFQRVVEWAATNLSEAQIEAYNRAVDSHDPQRMQEAVQALAYQYSQARPQEPNLVGGNGQGRGDVFESVAQLTEAMGDPRYHSDPAYRRQVEQKLARSNIL